MRKVWQQLPVCLPQLLPGKRWQEPVQLWASSTSAASVELHSPSVSTRPDGRLWETNKYGVYEVEIPSLFSEVVFGLSANGHNLKISDKTTERMGFVVVSVILDGLLASRMTAKATSRAFVEMSV